MRNLTPKQKLYEDILIQMLDEHDVHVQKWVKTSIGKGSVAQSFVDDRIIEIPRPTTLWNLLVGLHEIGHIVIGNKRLRYYEEYLVEQWTLQQAAEFNLHSKKYLESCKLYVLELIICDIDIKFKRQNLKQEVLDWLQLTRRDVCGAVKAGRMYLSKSFCDNFKS